jgi:hypothetical protein
MFEEGKPLKHNFSVSHQPNIKSDCNFHEPAFSTAPFIKVPQNVKDAEFAQQTLSPLRRQAYPAFNSISLIF